MGIHFRVFSLFADGKNVPHMEEAKGAWRQVRNEVVDIAYSHKGAETFLYGFFLNTPKNARRAKSVAKNVMLDFGAAIKDVLKKQGSKRTAVRVSDNGEAAVFGFLYGAFEVRKNA